MTLQMSIKLRIINTWYSFQHRCVIHLPFFFSFVFFAKIGKNHCRTSIAKMWWLTWKRRGLYVVFNTLFQIWPKSQYLQHMPLAQTYIIDKLTDWLPDKIDKWMTEWMNVSLMPHWFVTKNVEIKGKKVFFHDPQTAKSPPRITYD